jgi:hypothetical protein
MRLLSDIVGDVRIRGPYAAAQNDAENAVRRCFVELCERAPVWVYEQEFDLQYNVPDYPILPPDDTRLVAVQWVMYNGRKHLPGLSRNACACGPFMISVPDVHTVVISPPPYPACPTTVTISLWLAPLLSVCDIPNDIYEEYSDTIADGAAARLLTQPKQDYTNVGLGQRMFGLYLAGITRAKNKTTMQHTTGPIMMRGSYF